MNGQIDGTKIRLMDREMYVQIDGWLDSWMYRQRDGQIDGWIDRYIDGQIY